MDLRNQQIKETYGNLATINTVAGTPTTGVLQNGAGSNVTTLTIAGTLDATNVDATNLTGTLTGNVVATNLTGTLQTAAQTNITSVGTLTGLTVSGNANFDSGTLFVDASTNGVGIGTSSPQFTLDANGTITRRRSSSGTTASPVTDQVIGLNAGGNFAAGITAINTNDSNFNVELGFLTRNATGNGVERLRIDSSGNVGIGTSSPSAKLHVVGGNIKVGNTYGIDFSDTADGSGTTTSEVLDDYEEGTWTPNIANTSGFDTVVSADVSRYTKIGNVVYLNAEFALAGSTGNVAAGDDIVLTSGSLPFAPSVDGRSVGHGGIQFNMSTGEDIAMAYVGISGGYQLGIVFHTVDGTVPRTNPILATIFYYV